MACRHTAFDTSHPSVPLAYFAAMIVLTMCSMQPMLIAWSLAGALLFCICTRGAAAALASLRWQLAMVALIAVVNPLFSSTGSTELFRIGTRAVYLESFVYGLCMGGLFMATALWFQAAAQVLSFDKVTALLGNALPVVALMMSMSIRLVPRLVRKAAEISRAQEAAGRSDGVRGRLRVANVLMGWSMEDSIETADAMRARGWSAGGRRTTYVRYRFDAADAWGLAGVGALAFAAAACAAVATAACSFYPRLTGLVPWWAYAPFAAFAVLPAVLHTAEQVSWYWTDRGGLHD